MDQCAIVACQIFNLDRAYRLNGNSKLLLIAVLPFMYVLILDTIHMRVADETGSGRLV